MRKEFSRTGSSRDHQRSAISLRRSLCNALEIRVQWPGQEKKIRRHVSQPESIVRQWSNTWSVGGRSLAGPKSSSLWLRCLLLWFFSDNKWRQEEN